MPENLPEYQIIGLIPTRMTANDQLLFAKMHFRLKNTDLIYGYDFS